MSIFLKRFLPYFKQYKLFFFLAVFGTAMTGACTAWGAYLVRPALDGIFLNKNVQMLYFIPLLLVLSFLGKGIGTIIRTYFINYIGLDIVRHIRNRMFDKMLGLEIAFFNQMRKGELIARMTNDVNLIRHSVSTYLSQSVQEVFTILALVFVVIYQSPKLAVIGLVIIPLAIYPLTLLVRSIRRVVRRNQEKNSDITARLTQVLSNIEVIKTSNGEEIELNEFQEENYQFFKIGLKDAFLGQVSSPLMEFLGALAVGLIIFLGGKEVVEGNLSAGAFFSFMTALFMLYTPIKRLVGMISSFQEASVASDRIFEILDREPGIVDGGVDIKESIESIQIRDVSLCYGDSCIFRGVNVTLQKNDICAFIGKSGSGKSSLVNLILRLYDPSSGEVLFNGKNIKNFNQKSLRERIGVVNQRIFILHDSILANVAYGEERDENKVLEALRQADAMDFVNSLKEGVHTILDEFGANLSGGQRQRIAIARAIYKNPEVLILDEATSALDQESEESIRNTIDRIAKDKIVIVIAHRPSTLQLANKFYCFDGGSVRLSNCANSFI